MYSGKIKLIFYKFYVCLFGFVKQNYIFDFVSIFFICLA